MEPLTTNDDEMMVYCDWLEDEGRSEESEDLREDIINPNVDSWHWECRNYNHAGVNVGSGVGFDGLLGGFDGFYGSVVGVKRCGFNGVGLALSLR